MYIEERLLALEKENLKLTEQISELRKQIQEALNFTNKKEHIIENSNDKIIDNFNDSEVASPVIKEIILQPKETKSHTFTHDDIIEKLKATRLSLAKNEKLPAYCIVSNKAIEEMAKYLPSTDYEFLEISGIGIVKLNKYGRFFLEDIKNIKKGNIIENKQAKNIETRLKATPVKVTPHHLTYEVYKEFHDLDQIAKHRKMTKYSVIRDLITCSKEGFEDILFSDFLTKQKVQLFIDEYYALDTPTIDNLRDVLPKSFENYEIMICKYIIEKN